MNAVAGVDDRWLDRALAGRWGVLLAAFAGWTVLAAIPTSSAYIAVGGSTAALWWQFFRPIVIYYYGWALVTPLIYVLLDRLPLAGAHGLWVVLVHAALLAGFSFAATAIHGAEWHEWAFGRHAVGYHTMSAVSYAFALLVCVAVRSHRRALAREHETAQMRLRAARLDSQLSEARIDALRMQMNPHFLFNALNSIAALIESSRNAEAYRTTELLGQLLRAALSESRQVDVPLEEELGLVGNYLALEQVRFGERLRYESHVSAQARRCTVPAMILQPLVENAVKHGVARSERTVTVSLEAHTEAGTLIVEIQDDGPGFDLPIADRGTVRGHGLGNVRDRLALRFGGEASCDITRRPQGGTSVQLRIPVVT